MNIITAEDRLILYKRMLKLLQNGEEKCFCWAAQKAINPSAITLDIDIKLFPELMAYKPTCAGAFWFHLDDEGVAKRIDILEKVIDEMFNASVGEDSALTSER
jgi:hypothetical protein